MAKNSGEFVLVEASISELHAAINAGVTTVTEVVRSYIARAQAFNGVSSVLVTQEGENIPETPGVVRAGKELTFPTQTIPVKDI